MNPLTKISNLPPVPAVYALFSGNISSMYYGGIAKNLKTKIIQHLIKRYNNIFTGMSTFTLNHNYINKIKWWEYPKFENIDFIGRK